MSEGMGNRGRSLGHGSRAGAKWDTEISKEKGENRVSDWVRL